MKNILQNYINIVLLSLTNCKEQEGLKKLLCQIQQCGLWFRTISHDYCLKKKKKNFN